MKPVVIYRWIVFLLAVGYCLRMIFFGTYDVFAGPFRYLTIWALFLSLFCASRMLAFTLGRSRRRWDGVVSMTAVINTMVVILFWRLYFADPASVTSDGQLGAWHLELYLHLAGPLLQVIDSIFIHRSYRRPLHGLGWFLGVIAAYVAWVELVVQRINDLPAGTVTSGLPYLFLNNLPFEARAVFYGTNVGVGIAVLLIYAGASALVSRRFPAPAAP